MRFALKFAIILISILFLTSNVFAVELTPRESKNSIAFKIGYHVYQDSSFTDFYHDFAGTFGETFNSNDLNSYALEFAYDRKFTPYAGLELSFGYSPANSKTYTNGSFALYSIGFAPSIKAYLPLGDIFSLYAGLGPDLDIVIGELKLKNDSNPTDSKLGLGVHGLVGVDWWFYRFPAEDNYQAAVSLFLEYKYSWINVPAADDQSIDEYNSSEGTSFTHHNLNVGGHMVFSGLRWHF